MTQDPLIFARPELLWLLLTLPGLTLLRFWSQAKGGSTMGAFTSPRLRDVLVAGASKTLGWTVFSMQICALGLFILALAQPRWGEEEIERTEGGRDIVIAIDTSRSMLATDLSPNRLTRATLAAQDLLSLLPGDRVGLIAFAGNAYLQAPLTTDHDAVAESIQSLDFYSVPKGGSVLGDALDLAIKTFEKSPARTHGLILFSDGADAEARIQPMIQRALENRILIITIGVGTEGGSLIPNPDPNARGDYIRDASGNVVQTKLESGLMRELATATRGAYLTLGSRSLAASGIVQQLQQLDMQLVAATESTRPIERFQWPLGAGMLLLMIAWMLRPGRAMHMATPRVAVASAASLMLALLPPSAKAAQVFGISLPFFGSSEQVASPEEALQAYEEGDFEAATEQYQQLFKSGAAEPRRTAFAYGLGTASRSAEKFDEAVDAFSEALKHDDSPNKLRSHQGLAHSLYDQGDRTLVKAVEDAAERQQQGKKPDPSSMERMAKFTVRAWQDSIKHFDAALDISPEDAEIEENREFVQKRLDDLQQMMEQQRQQQQQQQGQQQQQNQGDGEQQQQQGQQGDQQQQGQSGQQPGEEQQREGENQDGDGDGEDQQKGESLAKEGNENQKGPLPEGDIQAADDGGEEGEEEANGMAGGDEMNEDTGFSANEARAFLRSYADDQKSIQLRQQREPPANGKDW